MTDKALYRCTPMTQEAAACICKWVYAPPYQMYSLDCSKETLEELLDGSYHAIYLQDELIGFYCTGLAAQVPSGRASGHYHKKMVDVGLGMKPNRTGQHQGYPFVSFILAKVREQEEVAELRLTVANWNKRAITLYKQFKFEEQIQFSTKDTTFIIMETC
ncbi:acetyltransferase [Bacillus sp. JCM 19046]|uniref:Ribosomal protein S18 acetylase RimI-like enzyme n=1 Tax=Shouchella xiaoxiensis TaxID=766895 RepID=A0ABS2STV5_9BACI|nr:GNAT family N-acetyltransferase [Shouchella xiaoxiensis]MBM7838245.1 ribosomal protein S18 acetylase RimI-like enzyme [Shouchella xiaoxiensis]GAF12119.1 acetyltransferase [Bacillus sp. JCM 19045]GAF17908.1 acetyltransferase [Bacillus sp. JCM 19046]